jgi:hypothetical protein
MARKTRSMAIAADATPKRTALFSEIDFSRLDGGHIGGSTRSPSQTLHTGVSSGLMSRFR